MCRQPNDSCRALLDLAPSGLAALDAEGRVLDINAAGLALLGEPVERVRGVPLDRWLDPGTRDAWAEHLEQAGAAGRSLTLAAVLRDSQGRTHSIRVVTRRGPAGGWLTVLTAPGSEADDGAGGPAERAFAQDVLDALPSQVAVLDARGIIIAVNRAWRCFALENAAPEHVRIGVGLDYLAACARHEGAIPDEGEDAAEGIRSVLEGGRPLFTLEYPCHSPDQQRWFLLTASPLAGSRGGAVIAHIDITARKLAQQQARERQQALARAARLNTVGALSSALAHEMAQPLTAIGHFNYAALTLLGTSAATQEIRSLLRQTEEQVDRAAAIVQRLKEFIRHGTLHKEEADVHRATADAVDLVGHLAAREGVLVRLRCPEQPLRAWIDHIQITQVIVNLLCNSIEAMEQTAAGQREIDIHLVVQDAEIRVTVSDTGPGLDPARGDRIFDVFETGKSTGAGIGLAVGRSIAEAHGGRLWAEQPSPPRGAVFHLTLPVPP